MVSFFVSCCSFRSLHTVTLDKQIGCYLLFKLLLQAIKTIVVEVECRLEPAQLPEDVLQNLLQGLELVGKREDLVEVERNVHLSTRCH